MSDTPTPSLLSEERLAEIQEAFNITRQVRAVMAQPEAAGLDMPTNETADYYAAMVFDLLADRIAYRQQVAAELRGLLVQIRPLSACFDPKAQERQRINSIYNTEIHAAAARLNLDLTPAP